MDDPRIAEYISQLKYWDQGVAEHASEALGKIGAAAVPALVEALKGDNIYIRRKAPGALGKIGGAAVIPVLLEALSHNDGDVRIRAAEALGAVGDVTTVPALLEAGRHNDHDVRQFVGYALPKIGDFEKLARSLLALPGLSAQERVAFLEELRAPYEVRNLVLTGVMAHGARRLPDTRSLCQTVLEEEDADARAGARAVLNWLDRDQYLVRAAESDPASANQTLLRPVESGNGTTASDTLLRPVEVREGGDRMTNDMKE
jgi:HEAT repeat protein